MKSLPVTARDRTFREEFLRLIAKHYGDESTERVLAVASGCVGQIIAMQDQRTMNPDRAMRIVMANIEEGNRSVIEDMARMPAAGSA